MKKLLIATTNPGKFAELKSFLSDVQIEAVSLKDIKILERPQETGKSFDENAKLKALFYMNKSGLPTLADDGGFEIDAFGGAPGVKSHRWIHQNREDTDKEIIEHVITKMKDIPVEKRGAQLRLVLVFALPNGEIFTAEDKIRGIVAQTPSRTLTEGFPYRSLLLIPELNKFYDQHNLTAAENDKYNHRKRALTKLKPLILRYLV